jgi:hypothetical protein
MTAGSSPGVVTVEPVVPPSEHAAATIITIINAFHTTSGYRDAVLPTAGVAYPYTRLVHVSISRAIALGLAAGFVGGLFGIGGGVVVVPGLVLWFKFSPHNASGTSVATIIASAGAALASFAGTGSVDWRAAAFITCGAIVGAAIGARILDLIPAKTLTRAFSLLLVIAAVRMAII